MKGLKLDVFICCNVVSLIKCHMVTNLISYNFVDRDMFIYYWGGGFGHKMTQDWAEMLYVKGQHDLPGDEKSSSDSDDKGIDMDHCLASTKDLLNLIKTTDMLMDFLGSTLLKTKLYNNLPHITCCRL